MFYRLVKVAFVCSVFTFGICFSALAASDIKVGIMNIQKVLVQSEPGVQAKERFEKKKNELEATFENEQKSLQQLKEEIEKKSSVWSKEKKDEKVLEFNKMRRDLQGKSEDARLEMKALQDKELEPIIKTLEKIVDTYGEKNGFSLILDSKAGVVYYGEALDISDDLIKELNKAMK